MGRGITRKRKTGLGTIIRHRVLVITRNYSVSAGLRIATDSPNGSTSFRYLLA